MMGVTKKFSITGTHCECLAEGCRASSMYDDIAHLRGMLLVAHGVIMKATGGDESGKYKRDIDKIRAALTRD
jgi:hypothetical protein